MTDYLDQFVYINSLFLSVMSEKFRSLIMTFLENFHEVIKVVGEAPGW